MEQVRLTEQELTSLLNRIKGARVCVLGDVCLDLYWYADMKRSTLSRETPHFPLPVVEERFSLGGGGNVIQNLAALGVGTLLPISVMGCDWRGELLNQCFAKIKVETRWILRTSERITPCYCKPIRMGISQLQYEDPRIDFENHQPISREIEDRLISSLEQVAKQVDIIAVADQFTNGVVTKRVREKLAELSKAGHQIVVDSRDRINLFENVVVKPNEVEAALAVGENPKELKVTPERYESIVKRLTALTGKAAVVTLGDKGALWCENGQVFHAPAVKAEPADIVGAGDTFLSALCAALAVGESGGRAVAFGNLASGVTVKKIGTTGTASPEEIRKQFQEEAQ